MERYYSDEPSLPYSNGRGLYRFDNGLYGR